MIWTRKPKSDAAAALDVAGTRMMEAIVTGRGRGMAWIEFLAADAAHEAAQQADNDEAHPAPERKTT